MERLGAINEYIPYQWRGESVYTINLANGVTPMFHFIGGREYASSVYKLSFAPITVTYGQYRPDSEEFATLLKSVQDHILNGGLLIAPLREAIEKQMFRDPVAHVITNDRFQTWCRLYYGRYL